MRVRVSSVIDFYEKNLKKKPKSLIQILIISSKTFLYIKSVSKHFKLQITLLPANIIRLIIEQTVI